VIAVSDWVRAVPEQIRPFVPARYRTLGTDGFGRSDGRERLRHFFEVNRFFIAVAALKTLSDDGRLPPAAVRQAIEKYGIDPEKPDPTRS
jgi:pyruvate dehydrogenase E1 component